ncbi:hypothetical protein KUCAC02_031640, partial [Chaenocephalus aceratus]
EVSPAASLESCILNEGLSLFHSSPLHSSSARIVFHATNTAAGRPSPFLFTPTRSVAADALMVNTRLPGDLQRTRTDVMASTGVPAS